MTSTTALGAPTPTGDGTAGTPVRRRRPRSLAVLLAVCVAVLLSAVPGTASAAPPDVTPFVDCFRVNSDGSHTFVFGYTNANDKRSTIPYGHKNVLDPSQFQRAQPKYFLAGTHRGVFSLRLSAADLAAGPRWVLDGKTLDLRSAGSAAQCSPSTPLPALGNGAGLALVLVAGGVFGVFFVRRSIRGSAASD